VVHLVADMTGAYPGERGLSALLAKYPDLPAKLLPLGAALKDGSGLSYTQWEAWLALYHHKLLLIARAAATAEREPQYAPTDASRTAQDAHLARLSACLKSPRRPITRPERPAFESDTGRSALAPGTAESAPKRSFSTSPTIGLGWVECCRSSRKTRV
jgi:hypothetical protein